MTRSLVQCDTSEAEESVQLKANNAPTQHLSSKADKQVYRMGMESTCELFIIGEGKRTGLHISTTSTNPAPARSTIAKYKKKKCFLMS